MGRINTMNKFGKNKWAVIGVGAVVVVIAVAGVIFISQRSVTKAPQIQQTPEEQTVQMKPEDIGLTLRPNAAATEVEMKISDVSKFDHFDFEMNYDAIVNGETVPKGAIGSGDVNPGESSVDRKITIGTCSSGTCKYDKGVTKISFVIKLTLKNGKSAVVQKDLVLSGDN